MAKTGKKITIKVATKVVQRALALKNAPKLRLWNDKHLWDATASTSSSYETEYEITPDLVSYEVVSPLNELNLKMVEEMLGNENVAKWLADAAGMNGDI